MHHQFPFALWAHPMGIIIREMLRESRIRAGRLSGTLQMSASVSAWQPGASLHSRHESGHQTGPGAGTPPPPPAGQAGHHLVQFQGKFKIFLFCKYLKPCEQSMRFFGRRS